MREERKIKVEKENVGSEGEGRGANPEKNVDYLKKSRGENMFQ